MLPKLICLTPIKNEAWILNTFLTYASEWADYIIIADQNSTDNSREIALNFAKVIYIENKSKFYNEAERQQLLINEARKIPGPRILVTLDADEIFSLNYRQTKDWKKILNSLPGDVFAFKWANINSDKKTYFPSHIHYPWVVNDIECEHKHYVKTIHSMRIPFPDTGHDTWYNINDFFVLHFNWTHKLRIISKNRYYQCVHFIIDPIETPISLHRSYNESLHKNYNLNTNWITSIDGAIFNKIDFSKNIFWWDEEVIKLIRTYGIDKYKYLSIWDNKNFQMLLLKNSMQFKRSILVILFHKYLKFTQYIYPSKLVSIADKLLTALYKFTR